MITVTWKHIVLDPVVYTMSRSHRAARTDTRIGMSGGLFPVVREGTWSDPGFSWSPDRPEKGFAPATDTLPSTGAGFLFAFWSVVARTPSPGISGGSTRTIFADVFFERQPVVDLTAGANVQATAWYVWDFGGGPGAHAAYLDAFDITEGRFIPDDFVDVTPTAALTPEANDGLLGTETIKEEVVTARDPAGDVPPPRYFFQWWRAVAELETAGPQASIEGQRITLHRANVINAIAFYRQAGPFERIIVPREGWYIIGSLADGPMVIFGPGGPQPIGPWDPTMFKQILTNLQKIADDIRGMLGEKQ